jgi:hypothetical protein
VGSSYIQDCVEISKDLQQIKFGDEGMKENESIYSFRGSDGLAEKDSRLKETMLISDCDGLSRTTNSKGFLFSLSLITFTASKKHSLNSYHTILLALVAKPISVLHIQ